MRNCLIFGSGRSGTSMLAGMLRNSGYQMGDNYIVPRVSNPKGFFEDSEINRINEQILAHSLQRYWPQRLKGWLGQSLPENAHWLAEVPLRLSMRLPAAIAPQMSAKLAHQPFCFKDPRFSFTLPAWRRFLPGDIRYLVVFRNPEATIRSILREWRETTYLSSMRLDERNVSRIWQLVYRHVLEKRDEPQRYLFVHFDRILDGSSWSAIESFLATSLDCQFPDARMSRSATSEVGRIDPGCREVYERLLELQSEGQQSWSANPEAA